MNHKAIILAEITRGPLHRQMKTTKTNHACCINLRNNLDFVLLELTRLLCVHIYPLVSASLSSRCRMLGAISWRSFCALFLLIKGLYGKPREIFSSPRIQTFGVNWLNSANICGFGEPLTLINNVKESVYRSYSSLPWYRLNCAVKWREDARK